MNQISPPEITERPQRFTSHALVDVRKFKHLPFFAHSAVLLDLSVKGFKLEFTSDVTIGMGEHFWLNIPLTPLGIYAPARLLVQIECKWFDEKRFRIGGVFAPLTNNEQLIIEQVVDALKDRERKT